MGFGIVASLVPSSLKMLARGLKETKIGAGWVRFFNGKHPPLPKEIDAAEFLAERTGAKVYIRGANQAGSDFLMNGFKYELYSPTTASKFAVSRAIRDKIGRQGAGRLVLDARNCNLPDFKLYEAIEHAISEGTQIIEVVIINRTGKILYWM